MAFNNGFPATYQPNFYGQINPYYQQNPAMMQQNIPMMQQNQQNQQMQQAQQSQQIQQSGFVPVRSEQEARSYPVAPGNSVTFKDENAPYCYVKTMGFNQLDQPTFERYRLVKEESQNIAVNDPKSDDSTKEGKVTDYALKSDIEAIRGELDDINAKLKSLSEKKTIKKSKLTNMEDDDDE